MKTFRETFGRGRRLAILVNVASMVALALVAAGVLVYVTGFTALHRRVDLTSTGTYTLSVETRQLLDELDADVEITTVFDWIVIPTDPDAVRLRAMEYCRDLLQEYQVRSGGRLTVTHLDPRRHHAEVTDLYRAFGLNTHNVVVVLSGGRHRVLGLETDLAEFELRGPQGPWALVAYRAEEALSGAIFSVTREEPVRIAAISGHGEMSITDHAYPGAAMLASLLRQDNCIVEGLSLNVRGEVPEDADVVLLLGPEEPFLERERAILDAWLARGGKLLAALDPLGDRSLDPLLEKAGARIERRILTFEQGGMLAGERATEQWVGPGGPGALGHHPITDGLVQANEGVHLIRSGAIDAVDVARPAAAGFTSLLLSHPQAFGDEPRGEREPGDFTFDPRTEERRQRTLGAALEPAAFPGARVVLIASRVWATNALLGAAPGNQTFLRRSIAWLAGKKKSIQLPPRMLRANVADLRQSEYDAIFRYTSIYLPGGALLLAVLVWLARRR